MRRLSLINTDKVYAEAASQIAAREASEGKGTSTDAAAARDTAARMAYSLEHQVNMLRSNLNRTFAPEVASAALAEILSNMAKDMGAGL